MSKTRMKCHKVEVLADQKLFKIFDGCLEWTAEVVRTEVDGKEADALQITIPFRKAAPERPEHLLMVYLLDTRYNMVKCKPEEWWHWVCREAMDMRWDKP